MILRKKVKDCKMKKFHDGGPAFPQLSIESGERDGHGDLIEPYTTSEGGMSLRDWFAGQALQGLLSNSHALKECAMAETAYSFADEMIRIRKNV